MERVFKEIGSSVIEVKSLLRELNQDNMDYIDNATKALKVLETLTDLEKSQVMKDAYIRYKYFDAKEAIKMHNDTETAKPVVKLLLALNKKDKNYEKKSSLALVEVRKLTAAQTTILLKNKSAEAKLSEAKATKVGNAFLTLNEALGTYTYDANKALDMYKILFTNEQDLVKDNEKVYKAYCLAIQNSVKCLLMKFNLEDENHPFVGREALVRYNLLPDSYKNSILDNLFYSRKLNMVNFMFDTIEANKLIEKLHNLYLASIQTNLTAEYFSYALRLISKYEGLTEGAKKLVDAQAAFELQIALAGKEAHPIVYLAEAFLPNKKHSKYYEIADILVSAYDHALTKIQKRYVNKSIYTMELINEAREDIMIQEKTV